MKILFTVIFLISLLNGFGQNKAAAKIALFNNLPTTINCTSTELNKLFATTQGQNTSLSFSNLFKCNGKVKSNLVRYQNLQTVAIWLPEFNNSIFSLSRRTDKKNNIIYCGRIFNRLNTDGYELKYLDNNTYQLIKFTMVNILSDCTLNK